MASRGPGDFDFNLNPSEIPVKALVVGIAAVVALLILWSCFFTVAPEEVGVIRTFGKYTSEAGPGLRLKWPRPIQTVVKVPVQRQLKLEFGYRTKVAGVRSTYDPRGYEGESLMLTGDLNVAEVEWTAQFRVKDPYQFLFKVRNVQDTFRDMNEAVMREVVGDRSVTEILTIGRQEIASEVEVLLQEMCDQYETGLKVEQIVLQDVNPPDPVKPAFNEVNQAQQQRERMINEARAEYNRIVPKAKGEAQQVIQKAEGYAKERVNRAEGDASRFKEILAAYRRAPEVTRRRIYLETMEAVYPTVKTKIILDKDLQGILPLLPLGQEVQR